MWAMPFGESPVVQVAHGLSDQLQFGVIAVSILRVTTDSIDKLKFVGLV